MLRSLKTLVARKPAVAPVDDPVANHNSVAMIVAHVKIAHHVRHKTMHQQPKRKLDRHAIDNVDAFKSQTKNFRQKLR
jgi:hypothetical protein